MKSIKQTPIIAEVVFYLSSNWNIIVRWRAASKLQYIIKINTPQLTLLTLTDIIRSQTAHSEDRRKCWLSVIMRFGYISHLSVMGFVIT